MKERINTALLCLILLALILLIVRRPSEVGRFQQIDTPAHQVAFDTKTGQRCWSWRSPDVPPDPKYDDLMLCADLARH